MSVLAPSAHTIGVPLPVERTLISSPGCRIGTISDDERATVRARSPVGGKYDVAVDRESAYEKLAARAAQEPAAPPGAAGKPGSAQPDGGWKDAARDIVLGTSRRQGMLEAMAKSFVRNAGGQLGRTILRGVLGSISRR